MAGAGCASNGTRLLASALRSIDAADGAADLDAGVGSAAASELWTANTAAFGRADDLVGTESTDDSHMRPREM